MRELAFCLSKEKIELFFQKSKIDLYMAQIDPALSEMKNKAPEIFFQVLDMTYHDKLLEICFGTWFSISDNDGSI